MGGACTQPLAASRFAEGTGAGKSRVDPTQQITLVRCIAAGAVCQKTAIFAGIETYGHYFCQFLIHLPTRATPAVGQKAKVGVLGQALPRLVQAHCRHGGRSLPDTRNQMDQRLEKLNVAGARSSRAGFSSHVPIVSSGRCCVLRAHLSLRRRKAAGGGRERRWNQNVFRHARAASIIQNINQTKSAQSAKSVAEKNLPCLLVNHCLWLLIAS